MIYCFWSNWFFVNDMLVYRGYLYLFILTLIYVMWLLYVIELYNERQYEHLVYDWPANPTNAYNKNNYFSNQN